MGTRPEHGMSSAEFESRRREISIRLLEQSETFMRLDNKMNEAFAEISKSLADYISANPEVLGPGGDRRLAAAPAGGGLAAAGTDVTGGGPLDSILGTIGDILTGEKEFIKEIVRDILRI